MISVEFKGVGAGRCVWCDKDRDEVFDVVFSDKSFVGMYCRADLLKAVTVKCKKATVTAQPAQALPVNGVNVGIGPGSSETLPRPETRTAK